MRVFVCENRLLTIAKPKLTAEDGRKGGKRAAEALGPVGRSVRATIAARARWSKEGRLHAIPDRPWPKPPIGWLLACLDRCMDGYADRPGYSAMRGKLAEVLAWLRDAK